jgi:hypothetical protein
MSRGLKDRPVLFLTMGTPNPASGGNPGGRDWMPIDTGMIGAGNAFHNGTVVLKLAQTRMLWRKGKRRKRDGEKTLVVRDTLGKSGMQWT